LHTKEKNSEVIIKEKEEIKDFLKKIEKTDEFIGKLFKSKYFESTKKIFEKELDEIRNVIGFYKKENNKYTTLNPLKYKTTEFIAVTINYSRSSEYIVFNKKCNNKFEINIIKMVKDVLESLVILQKNDFLHNDIKLDNMVYCEKKYKLIDWGNIMKIDFKHIMKGTFLTGHPIKFYLMGYSQYFIKQAIYIRTQTKMKEIIKSKLFNDIYKQQMKQFDEVMKKGLTKKEMIEKYKDSMDVYALGMTVVHAIIINNEKFEKYEKLVNYLLDMENPPKDAKVALEFIKKI
jgi:serine/threonine protein kinase